jgi:hypothetical protein
MSIAWLTDEQVSALNSAVGDQPRLKELLTVMLVPGLEGFPDEEGAEAAPGAEAKSALLSDLFFYAFAFARTNAFSDTKIAAFLSMFRDIVARDMEGGMRSVERSFQRLEELLLKLSTDRPPVSRGVFSPDDARKIAAFAMDNYYRQFKLYHACFAPKEQLVMKQMLPGMVQQAKAPRPLDEGLAVGEHREVAAE